MFVAPARRPAPAPSVSRAAEAAISRTGGLQQFLDYDTVRLCCTKTDARRSFDRWLADTAETVTKKDGLSHLTIAIGQRRHSQVELIKHLDLGVPGCQQQNQNSGGCVRGSLLQQQLHAPVEL